MRQVSHTNKRIENWSKYLAGVLQQYKNFDFQWGKHDCCMFISDCANAITGIDPAQEHRNHYSTKNGAKKALVRYGSIETTMDTYFSRINENLRQRGDICLFKLNDREHSVAVWFSDSWWGMNDHGIDRIKIKPLIVWGIGHE